MKTRFTFLSGGREGQTVEIDKMYLTIGRHPHSDLRFGPDRDLEVSSRHAAVLRRDGVFLLRDLGSTNGTYVNGIRLRGDHVLADHDVIRFGATGPEVHFASLHLTARRTPADLAATPADFDVPLNAPFPPPRAPRPTPLMMRAPVAGSGPARPAGRPRRAVVIAVVIGVLLVIASMWLAFGGGGSPDASRPVAADASGAVQTGGADGR